MKNVIKTIILILLIFIIFSIGILIFSNLKQNNEQYESNIINEKNSQTLQIYNTKITNLTERSRDNSEAMTKIKNVSNLNLSKIVLYYNELDENNNKVSNSKIYVDVTLTPEEVMQIQFVTKDYTNTIEVTGYSYIVEDSKVSVGLKNDEVDISENDKYLENSKNYEVMSIKKIDKENALQNDLSYLVEIENISQKTLGNIVLRIAEVNKHDEIISVDHVAFNSVLKPGQREEVISSLTTPKYYIKILGYTYDDIESKSNIDIDLITHKVNIIDNKK